MNIIALIPARGGSKRIPHKNIRLLNSHPLLAYSIQSAKDSGIFDGIYVSSDSEEIGKIAEYYGAIWIKRPSEFATDTSPDAEWIAHALKEISCDCFMILRPTSPFRTGETIKRAWKEWEKDRCMKAIEKIRQHPDKVWQLTTEKKRMYPLGNQDRHLLPIQNLCEFYIQNGSLEIRPINLANGKDSIHQLYQPFFTQGYEGFDLNVPDDFILAEALIEKDLAILPKIEKEPYEPAL